MLTHLGLVCRRTWWQTSRDDFKQASSHLGEHHWAGRICKLCSAHSSLISQQSYEPGCESRRGELCWSIACLFRGFPLLNYCSSWGGGGDAWICSLQKNPEAICLKAGICISIYTRCVAFLFCNPLLHFQVILPKLFLVSLVLIQFLISGGYLS